MRQLRRLWRYDDIQTHESVFGVDDTEIGRLTELELMDMYDECLEEAEEWANNNPRFQVFKWRKRQWLFEDRMWAWFWERYDEMRDAYDPKKR